MTQYRIAVITITTIISVIIASCKEITVQAPTVTLPQGELYTLKVGESITIEPIYTNAEGATFEWSEIGGSTLSSESTYLFTATQAATQYFSIKVSTAGGEDSAEFVIQSQELSPPVITLPTSSIGGYIVAVGTTLTIAPTISGSESSMSYQWQIDGGEVVSTDSSYEFYAQTIGQYTLSLYASNEDGYDYVEIDITVLLPEEMPIEWSIEKECYNLSAGRSVLVSLLDVVGGDGATYSWAIDGVELEDSNAPEFIFEGVEQGSYTLSATIQRDEFILYQQFEINVCPAEGTYKRSSSSSSSSTIDKVYEYTPAPGQYINSENEFSTAQEAATYAEERLLEAQYISLGGFGGYIIAGFDHSIENDGGYNIAIRANQYAGSSEPAIVWVMQDENGDGLPNDTWYELKGSEHELGLTTTNYAVTYYRPSAQSDTSWSDNQGQSGQISYLGAYHSQEYYYPTWIEAESYTLRGTLLQSRTYQDDSDTWVNDAFGWGYADNLSDIDMLDSSNDNHFKIGDAIRFDQQTIELQYIDFIKIVSAVNDSAGWLGEVSPEIIYIEEYKQAAN